MGGFHVTHASSLDPRKLESAPAGPPLTAGQRAIAPALRERMRRGEPVRDLLDFMVAEVKREFPAHSWSGVYLREGDVLVLGPFRGPDTPHKRIRVGDEGICGWVAREGRPQVIPDVNADPRYLSCSVSVRSEIVVPIVHGGAIHGVIDIDSETPSAFTRTDLDALAELAAIVAPAFAQAPRGGAGR
jgi:GAF domain-containing protein